MLRKTVLLATLLLAFPLLAADLGKYKDWLDSPAAYFITSAERTEWASVRTEADAEAFVRKYTEARGGEKFTAELNKRIQMADKYLTVGSTPGSQTTRGRIVIVLGPPKAMDVAVKANKGRVASMPSAGIGDEMERGPSVSEVADVAQLNGMAGASVVKIYTFTYDKVTVPVEVTVSNGKDRIRDKKAQRELDRVLEEAAQASIAVK